MDIETPSVAEGEQAHRCFRCFRPLDLCFCDTIPKINNLTDVLIVQHRREHFHAFNTARIVNHALQRCTLMTDHTDALIEQFTQTELSPNAGLLFPSLEARSLTDLSPDERPDQLIVLDGTWNQAKSLVRSLPRLQELPHYSLSPDAPSRYRIRQEPNEQAISTVEATVAALQALEPGTAGFDRLIEAFDRMIDNQIERSESNLRKKKKRRSIISNVPRLIHGDLSNVVVAYGELDQGGQSAERDKHRLPVYWMAKRLGSGEVFRCAIETQSSHDPGFLNCLRLTPADYQNAVSVDEFHQRWKAFLRPTDNVAVYHSSTATVLTRIDAELAPAMVLKSVKIGQGKGRGTLDDVVRSLGIEIEPLGTSRASERLACAIGFTRHLNSLTATHE
ncbi:MAG: tRNA-uridine aminocarboxypropyltransferase [Rubripirellula sp.]